MVTYIEAVCYIVNRSHEHALYYVGACICLWQCAYVRACMRIATPMDVHIYIWICLYVYILEKNSVLSDEKK